MRKPSNNVTYTGWYILEFGIPFNWYPQYSIVGSLRLDVPLSIMFYNVF